MNRDLIGLSLAFLLILVLFKIMRSPQWNDIVSLIKTPVKASA